MIRKFECWSCRKHFNADNQGQVKCPYCHSDNVELVERHIGLWKKLFLIVLIVSVPLIIMWQKGNNNNQGGDNYQFKIHNHSNEQQQATIEIRQSPIICQDTVWYDNKRKSYVIKVDLKFPPLDAFKLVLADQFGGDSIQESKTGIFRDVPPSENKGVYRVLLVMEESGDTLLSTEVTGCVKVIQISDDKKMTQEQLQILLNNYDLSICSDPDNPYIAPNAELVIKGLTAGENMVRNLTGVVEKLKNGLWTSAKVVGLEYDKMGRVCRVTVKVTKAEDDW